MIELTNEGSWEATERWLKKLSKGNLFDALEKYGQQGVAALSAATPQDSGQTATSWSYEVILSGKSAEIVWKNSNQNNGFPVAIMLQYGHGTKTGGYVTGRDYINPSIKPTMDKIADDVWKAVTA